MKLTHKSRKHSFDNNLKYLSSHSPIRSLSKYVVFAGGESVEPTGAPQGQSEDVEDNEGEQKEAETSEYEDDLGRPTEYPTQDPADISPL